MLLLHAVWSLEDQGVIERSMRLNLRPPGSDLIGDVPESAIVRAFKCSRKIRLPFWIFSSLSSLDSCQNAPTWSC